MDNKQQQQERSQDSFILHHSNPNGFDLPNIEANYFNCAAKFNMTPYKSWPSWVGRRKKFSAENSCVQQHIRVQPGASLELTRRKIVSGGAKLLQREFEIRSINRKALHLLQH
jgi:hypothetical protein